MTEVARPKRRRGAGLPVSVDRHTALRGATRRMLRDERLVPSILLVAPVLLMAAAVGAPSWPVGGLVVAHLAAQLAFSVRGAPHRGRHVAAWAALRFVLMVAFVASAQVVLQNGMLAILYLPIIGAAATTGAVPAAIVSAFAVLGHGVEDVLDGTPPVEVALRAAALAVAAAIVVLIARVEIGRLRRGRDRLRQAVQGDRRRSRQIAGVEAVGRILATSGPSREALDEVVARISRELGYQYVSIYLSAGTSVRLGAQRGYSRLIESFDGSRGIVGRVMRTRRPAFVPDVSADADYWSLNPDVRSEICAPLLADDEFLGFVNVESTTAPLDATDLRAVVAIADRLAAALIIGRERQQLAERVELFRHLHEFSEAINGTLEEEALYRSIVRSVSDVVPSDVAALCILERSSGRYILRALAGNDDLPLGIEVRPGEGMAGRAIRDRTLVVDPRFSAASYPSSVADAQPQPPMMAAAVPLMRDRVVIGALTVLRRDVDHAFSKVERDALAMLAEQASLAVANVFLHADVAELAIRDPLTGLFNRRYFDPALEQLFAQRSRLPYEERPPLAAILFDLDHFSQLNNAWGHQAGDAVLRAFGAVLRERMRTTDLLARFGGEEFVAILYRADLDAAMRVAEEVRAQIDATPIEGFGAEPLHATVSAGCAAVSDETDTPEALLRAADVALYMAKRAGRDRVVAA